MKKSSRHLGSILKESLQCSSRWRNGEINDGSPLAQSQPEMDVFAPSAVCQLKKAPNHQVYLAANLGAAMRCIQDTGPGCGFSSTRLLLFNMKVVEFSII